MWFIPAFQFLFLIQIGRGCWCLCNKKAINWALIAHHYKVYYHLGHPCFPGALLVCLWGITKSLKSLRSTSILWLCNTVQCCCSIVPAILHIFISHVRNLLSIHVNAHFLESDKQVATEKTFNTELIHLMWSMHHEHGQEPAWSTAAQALIIMIQPKSIKHHPKRKWRWTVCAMIFPLESHFAQSSHTSHAWRIHNIGDQVFICCGWELKTNFIASHKT